MGGGELDTVVDCHARVPGSIPSKVRNGGKMTRRDHEEECRERIGVAPVWSNCPRGVRGSPPPDHIYFTQIFHNENNNSTKGILLFIHSNFVKLQFYYVLLLFHSALSKYFLIVTINLYTSRRTKLVDWNVTC